MSLLRHHSLSALAGLLFVLSLSMAPADAGVLWLVGGDPCEPKGMPTCGDPINVAVGNVFEKFTDYESAGPNRLAFIRYFNGNQNITGGLLGNWSTNYDAWLSIGSSEVDSFRSDGKQIGFFGSGNAWTGPKNLDVKLTRSGSTWTLRDWNDTVETYTDNGSGLARLTSIKERNGYTRTLHRNGTSQLTSVTDSYGRTLTFTYPSTSINADIATVTTPDGLVITYGYGGAGVFSFTLTHVSYSTSPATSQTLSYAPAAANAGHLLLTGIVDENGHSLSRWTYENTFYERATSSRRAGGVDLTQLAYKDPNQFFGDVTVTNALGQKEIYRFTTIQPQTGIFFPVNTQIDRVATATTAAASRKFTYDANGFLASETDWNGSKTTYVNNSRGLPTQITEAAGTPQQRVRTITYHSKFRLALKVVEPGLTTDFSYDAAGNLLQRTETDTTTPSALPRTWTFTWSNSLLASEQDPRGNTTTYGYADGTLVSVTNARGQQTSVTQHTPGGLPLTIVDANGVTTHLTYDARQRLTSETVDTTGGARVKSYTYDKAGNLTSVTLPGGAKLAYAYDAANRRVLTTDLFDRKAARTLDALGSPTLEQLSNSSGLVTFKRSASYDALGRVTAEVRGAGQRTTFAYDADGNATSIVTPLGRTTAQVFDALDRVIRIVDPLNGVSTFTYDAHDRPLQVKDPKGGVTKYAYNGFGEVGQIVSPDTGTTTFAYDRAGNLLQRKDARGAVVTYGYDALNRRISDVHSGASGENVTYRYDEAAAGFGKGRLTSVTDAAGTLKFTYDERGNVTREIRTIGSRSFTTSYTYDAAGRRASVVNPSGYIVRYGRDAMGQVILVTLQAPSAAAKVVVKSVGYRPFGPVQSFTYGNGVLETATYDLSYRQMKLTTAGNNAVQNLTYSYNPADEVSKITDAVNTGQTQTFGYDALDRLTHAVGAYGTIGYTYDRNGNRLSQTKAGANFTYTYGAGNLLTAVKQGSTPVRSFAYTFTGNIKTDASSATLQLTYNNANRLSRVVKGSQTSTYTYDAFGQRRSAAVTGLGTTFFAYDLDGNLIEEAIGTERFDTIYFDGRPVARVQVSTGKVTYLHDDRLGTPQVATNAAQAVVWRASYQPFGATTPAGSLNQPFRFPGQYADPTGYSHNGFREYDPTLGRYLQSDPIGLGGGFNTFAYAGSNPLSRIDPLGLSDFGASIGDLTPFNFGAPASGGDDSYPGLSQVRPEARTKPESYLPDSRPTSDTSRADPILPDGSVDLCPPDEKEIGQKGRPEADNPGEDTNAPLKDLQRQIDRAKDAIDQANRLGKIVGDEIIDGLNRVHSEMGKGIDSYFGTSGF